MVLPVLLGAVYLEVRVAQLAELALVAVHPSLLRASLQVVAPAVLAVAPLAGPSVEEAPSGLPAPLEEAVEGLVAAVEPPLVQPSVSSA